MKLGINFINVKVPESWYSKIPLTDEDTSGADVPMFGHRERKKVKRKVRQKIS